ncbi:RING1 and YY1-binding protein B-like [Dreissena polymorpha]|uniref:RanBP2-type domain-containing protein n=1 Tax=Dreissena polymorpha TaxID=45954 RepID=A0A9D4GG99_DREPO|nr:RING1 and YY1-binding protein B-like [Dreissena polymorpha]KAH3816312.1 hypothetical protein DPMN_117825 [Dreissena polymorpha]
MEEKRLTGRAKRPAKPPEDGSWDCSVCTYKNSAEAYKCEMCDVRKGTSTRKPRLNQQLVAQQVAQQYAVPLSPGPGSPLAEDDNDPVYPDPDPRPVHNHDRFEPPPPPKHVIKKEKSAPAASFHGSKGEKSSAQLNKSNSQTKLNKKIKKRDIDRPANFKGTDPTHGHQMAVTVDNVTVIITDFQPKKRKVESATKIVSHSDISDSSSNASNDTSDDRLLHDNNG